MFDLLGAESAAAVHGWKYDFYELNIFLKSSLLLIAVFFIDWSLLIDLHHPSALIIPRTRYCTAVRSSITVLFCTVQYERNFRWKTAVGKPTWHMIYDYFIVPRTLLTPTKNNDKSITTNKGIIWILSKREARVPQVWTYLKRYVYCWVCNGNTRLLL